MVRDPRFIKGRKREPDFVPGELFAIFICLLLGFGIVYYMLEGVYWAHVMGII